MDKINPRFVNWENTFQAVNSEPVIFHAVKPPLNKLVQLVAKKIFKKLDWFRELNRTELN